MSSTLLKTETTRIYVHFRLHLSHINKSTLYCRLPSIPVIFSVLTEFPAPCRIVTKWYFNRFPRFLFLVFYYQTYFKQGFYIYYKKTSKSFWKLMHPLHHQYLFSVSGIIVSPYIAICSYSAASMKTIKALRNWIVHHKS